MVNNETFAKKKRKCLKNNEDLRESIEEDKMNIDSKEVKKIIEEGKHGHTWLLWMLQLILESIATNTPPSSIPQHLLYHAFNKLLRCFSLLVVTHQIFVINVKVVIYLTIVLCRDQGEHKTDCIVRYEGCRL